MVSPVHPGEIWDPGQGSEEGCTNCSFFVILLPSSYSSYSSSVAATFGFLRSGCTHHMDSFSPCVVLKLCPTISWYSGHRSDNVLSSFFLYSSSWAQGVLIFSLWLLPQSYPASCALFSSVAKDAERDKHLRPPSSRFALEQGRVIQGSKREKSSSAKKPKSKNGLEVVPNTIASSDTTLSASDLTVGNSLSESRYNLRSRRSFEITSTTINQSDARITPHNRSGGRGKGNKSMTRASQGGAKAKEKKRKPAFFSSDDDDEE